MATEIKDVKRVEAVEADLPTTVRPGQIGFTTDTFKMYRLYDDGATGKWWDSNSAIIEKEKVIFNLGDSVDSFAYITTDSTGNEFQFQSGFHSVNTPKYQLMTMVAAATEATSYSMFENQDGDELLKILSDGTIEISEGNLEVTNDVVVTGNILANGNIGVTGDTDLLTLASGVLSVNGSIKIDDGANIGIDSDTDLLALTSGLLTIAGSLKIADSGNVGIVSDTDLLALTSGVCTVNGNIISEGNIYGKANDTSTLGDATRQFATTFTNNIDYGTTLIFKENTTPRMTILTSSGYVGINEAAPDEMLEVNGDIHCTVDLHVDGVIIAGSYTTTTNDAQEYLVDGVVSLDYSGTTLRINKDTGYADVTIQGNVGVGVTPEAWNASYTALQVGGLGTLWSSTAAAAGGITVLSNNAYIDTDWKRIATDEVSSYLQINGTHTWYSDAAGTADQAFTPTARMTLDASGNLGINEVAPDEKLEVNGNIHGTGTIYTSGNIYSTAGNIYTSDGDIYTSADDDIYSVAWTDYSGTSTVVGWSSTTILEIFYKKVGKLVFCAFKIHGTGTGFTSSFTLPYAYNTDITTQNVVCVGWAVDNTTNAVGAITLAPGSSTFILRNNVASTTWAGATPRKIEGQFWFEVD